MNTRIYSEEIFKSEFFRFATQVFYKSFASDIIPDIIPVLPMSKQYILELRMDKLKGQIDSKMIEIINRHCL